MRNHNHMTPSNLDEAVEMLARTAVGARMVHSRIKQADGEGFWSGLGKKFQQSVVEPGKQLIQDNVVKPAINQVGSEASKHVGWGLGGAAVGAGLGAASQYLFEPRKRRRPLSAMLTGGLLGAGIGAGGSLLHSNYGSIADINAKTDAEQRDAEQETIRKLDAARATQNPNVEADAAAKARRLLPGQLTALARAHAAGGRDAAYNSFLDDAANQNLEFALAGDDDPAFAKTFKPTAPGSGRYRFGDQDRAELSKLLDTWVDKVNATGANSRLGRRTNDFSTSLSQAGAAISGGDLGTAAEKTVGRFGVQNLVGAGKDHGGGFLKTLERDLGGVSQIDVNSPQWKAVQEKYKNLGIDPFKVLMAYKEGPQGYNNLAATLQSLGAKRNNNGVDVPWSKDELQRDLPRMADDIRQQMGMRDGWLSQLADKAPTVTGNPTSDISAAVAGADFAGSMTKRLSNLLKGQSPSEILAAINEGRFPASIANDPDAIAYLQHAAKGKEEGIKRLMSDLNAYGANNPARPSNVPAFGSGEVNASNFNVASNEAMTQAQKAIVEQMKAKGLTVDQVIRNVANSSNLTKDQSAALMSTLADIRSKPSSTHATALAELLATDFVRDPSTHPGLGLAGNTKIDKGAIEALMGVHVDPNSVHAPTSAVIPKLREYIMSNPKMFGGEEAVQNLLRLPDNELVDVMSRARANPNGNIGVRGIDAPAGVTNSKGLLGDLSYEGRGVQGEKGNWLSRFFGKKIGGGVTRFAPPRWLGYGAAGLLPHMMFNYGDYDTNQLDQIHQERLKSGK